MDVTPHGAPTQVFPVLLGPSRQRQHRACRPAMGRSCPPAVMAHSLAVGDSIREPQRTRNVPVRRCDTQSTCMRVSRQGGRRVLLLSVFLQARAATCGMSGRSDNGLDTWPMWRHRDTRAIPLGAAAVKAGARGLYEFAWTMRGGPRSPSGASRWRARPDSFHAHGIALFSWMRECRDDAPLHSTRVADIPQRGLAC